MFGHGVQIQPIDQFNVVQKRQSADFVGLILGNVPSGTGVWF